jgi:hypothetical protein
MMMRLARTPIADWKRGCRVLFAVLLALWVLGFFTGQPCLASGATGDPPASAISGASGVSGASGGLSAIAELLPDVSLVGAFLLDYEHPLALAGAGSGGTSGTGVSTGESVEIGVDKTVDRYFRLSAYPVIGNTGASLLEGYATTLGLPWHLQVQAGYFLHHFGLVNAVHTHAYAFADRPLLTSRIFGADGGKGLGLQASYVFPLPFFAELAGAALDAHGATTARSFYGNSSEGNPPGPQDLLYVLTLKQHHGLPAQFLLSFGLSAAFGPNPTGRGNRTEVYGADLLLSHEGGLPLSLLSEWALRRWQVPGQVMQDLTGYAELRVGLWAARLHLAARYQFASGTSGDPLHLTAPTGAADRHVVELALLFQPTGWSLLRLQGALDLDGLGGKGPDAGLLPGDLLPGSGGATGSGGPSGPGYSVMLGLQLAIGAGRHGLTVME